MTLAKVRLELAQASPGIAASVFWVLHSDKEWPDRFTHALGAGVAVYLVTLIGALVAPLPADRLLGEEPPKDIVPPKRYVVGAALLATAVWVLMQTGQARLREEIAECVEQHWRETQPEHFGARAAVLSCYERDEEWVDDGQ